MNAFKRYIALHLFTLLVILVCSGYNIPMIASGTYGSGWKHDSNGNRTAGPSRGVTSVIYNARNLPEQVVFSDGSRLYGYYMGDGEYAGSREREKIITTVDGGTGTKATYLTTTRKQFGNFIETNSTLSRVYIDEGYIDVSSGVASSEYHYYVKDWQGSVRAIIDEEGELKQTVDYSAYGVPSTRYGMTEDNRLHLGLEWQSMKGWNSYQNNARTRDPLYARFQQQDPMADKYYPFSPYHYGACNPLRFMDFDGRKVVYSNDMSDSERFNLMETIANLRDSQLFSKVYDYLEKMKDIVTISFGETVKDQYGDNVAGQYVPNESDGGGTITFKDENSLSSFVAAEEIYHSYQNAVPNTNGVTNLEFEAKVFSVGVCANYLPLPQIPCLETFSKKIRSGIYGNNENNIASTNIIRFSLDYMKEGYKFSNHYLGNINYSMPVFNVPNRLLNLIY